MAAEDSEKYDNGSLPHPEGKEISSSMKRMQFNILKKCISNLSFELQRHN